MNDFMRLSVFGKKARVAFALLFVVSLLALSTAYIAARNERKAQRAIAKQDLRKSMVPKNREPFSTSTFAPLPLNVAGEDLQETHIAQSDFDELIDYPVGIAWGGHGHKYFVCNYKELYYVDMESKTCWRLTKPMGLSSLWVPTGLVFCAATQELFIANYVGKNIIVLDVKNPTKSNLVSEITHDSQFGPEGIDVTSDGRFLAVADYDGMRVSLFQRNGTLVWTVPRLPGAHGIAIGKKNAAEEPFIIAAVLGTSELIRINWHGKISKRTNLFYALDSTKGGRDSFLYPTGVIKSSHDDQFVVTDAFRGQLVVCTGDLAVEKTLGGNGPSLRLFNNPYNCAHNSETGRVVVADTFKDRLVEVDLRLGNICSSFYLSKKARGADRSAALGRKTQIDPASLAINYRRAPCPEDPSRILLSFRGLSPESHEAWLFSQSIKMPSLGIQLSTHGMSPMYGGYTWRFVAGKNGVTDGKPYFLLWSPQSSGLVMSWRDVAVSLPLAKDTWLLNGKLVCDDRELDIEFDALRSGTQKIQSFLSACERQTPLRAMGQALFDFESEKECFDNLRRSGISPQGKKYIEQLISNVDNRQMQWECSKDFLKEHPTHLVEVLLAETIMAGSQQK